jgi:hypothetical protein
MYTYCIKKPLDAKEEKIQKLLEDNKRYYPKGKNGKPSLFYSNQYTYIGSVDEWAAVIKHQAD